MNNIFPVIETIDDVLPAIQNKPEFIVAERDNYTVVNYVVTMPDTFENPFEEGISADEALYRKIRRECRGLIFSSSGKIISRPFSKFFNVNEKEETQIDKIDMSQPYRLFTKLDGSFIRPLPIGGQMFFATKMGITDIATQAYNFTDNHFEYIEFSFYCVDNNYTPIFEYISPNNRIVINYYVDNLVCLGIRNNYTGEYVNNFDEICALYNIPVVEHFNTNQIEKEGFARFIEDARNQTGIEGYVLRFDNGYMVKIKTEEYVLFHRSKEKSESEHLIIQPIVNEQIDDLKGLLFKEDLEKVNEIEKWFWQSIQNQEYKYLELQRTAYELSSGDKKKFALEIAPKMEKSDASVVFQIFDGSKDIKSVLLDRVKRNSNRVKQYDEFKNKFMI